jgi:peptidylprolyl isomerase
MGDAAGVTVEGGPGAKPGVSVPGGEPPGELVVHDVIEGSGDAVEPGAMVVAHYVGVGWSSGRQFDASWDRGAPLRLPLGQVIPGWQQGIPGMRPGGRRLLVVPAELAYGDRPPLGSGIGAGEALVFVIDLVR